METGFLKYSAKGVACAVVSAVVMLFALNLTAIMCDDPDKYLELFAILILIATSAICGFVSSGCDKSGGKGGVVCAAVSGAFYSALLILFSVLVRGEEGLNAKCLLLTLCAGVSVLAAFLITSMRSKASRPSPDKLRKTIAAKYQHS